MKKVGLVLLTVVRYKKSLRNTILKCHLWFWKSHIKSILGPLLFLPYINSIIDLNINIRFHGNNCDVYSTITSRSDQCNLQARVDSFMQWCKNWQMSVIHKKSAIMFITKKNHSLPLNVFSILSLIHLLWQAAAICYYSI